MKKRRLSLAYLWVITALWVVASCNLTKPQRSDRGILSGKTKNSDDQNPSKPISSDRYNGDINNGEGGGVKTRSITLSLESQKLGTDAQDTVRYEINFGGSFFSGEVSGGNILSLPITVKDSESVNLSGKLVAVKEDKDTGYSANYYNVVIPIDENKIVIPNCAIKAEVWNGVDDDPSCQYAVKGRKI
mgnify:CR=1 FL=1